VLRQVVMKDINDACEPPRGPLLSQIGGEALELDQGDTSETIQGEL
jgi:hypothetical protein